MQEHAYPKIPKVYIDVDQVSFMEVHRLSDIWSGLEIAL